MELHNENGVHVQNGTAKTINKVSQNGEAQKQHSIPAKKEVASNKAGAESPKPNPVKTETPDVAKHEQLKAEEPAKEARATPAKPVALEVTLKAVDILHRKSIQRLNLISRLKQIEAFEVALAQENDELEDNPYQGCKLIIADDKQRQFVTTTPGLIRLVSQFIFSACNEKLSEIEASIVFPNV
jgi:type IV secretory pathway VirB10-like protein